LSSGFAANSVGNKQHDKNVVGIDPNNGVSRRVAAVERIAGSFVPSTPTLNWDFSSLFVFLGGQATKCFAFYYVHGLATF
jgi:hypothetical protein